MVDLRADAHPIGPSSQPRRVGDPFPRWNGSLVTGRDRCKSLRLAGLAIVIIRQSCRRLTCTLVLRSWMGVEIVPDGRGRCGAYARCVMSRLDTQSRGLGGQRSSPRLTSVNSSSTQPATPGTPRGQFSCSMPCHKLGGIPSPHVQPAAAACRNRVNRASYLEPAPLGRVRVPRLSVHGARRALIIGDADVAQLRNAALRLARARDGLCHCQLLLQGRAFRAGYQDAEGQLAVRYLDGPATPERPPAQGDVLCLRPACACAQVPAGGLPAAFYF